MGDRLPHWLLGVILLLVAQGAAAAPGLTATLEPVWDGHFLPGRATEVRVHLLAESGGRFELALQSGSGRTRYRGILEAGTPQDLWLPLIPDPGAPVALTLWRDGERVLQQNLWFTASPAPLTISVQPLAPELPVDSASSTLSSRVDGLPRTGDGYRGVGRLVLPLELLPRLDRQQMAALRDYIGDCGMLLMSGGGANLLQRIKGIAGCNGEYIGITGRYSAAGPASAPAPAPAANPNAEPAHGWNDPIALFFAVYLVSLLLIAATWRRPAALLAAPLLGTLGLLLFWPLQDNPVQLVSWAEMQSGSANVRYSALLRIVGNRGEQNRRISLSSRLGMPGVENAMPLDIRFDALRPGLQSLVTQVRPFSRYDYRFQGSLPAPFRLRLELSDNSPRVTNRSDTETPAGLLSWNQEIYALPALPPGQSWSPTGSERIDGRGDPAKRLRQRAGSARAALLLPMTLQDAGLIAPDSGIDRLQGWLLVRPAGGLS